MADKEKALKLVDQRTAMIELLNNRLDKQVSASQKELLELIISDFVDQLETEGGKIANSAKNQRLVALLDKTFATFNETQGPAMVKTMVDAVQNVVSFNNKYFGTFERPANLVPINKRVISSVSDWLGITSEGGAAKNGYLDTLVKADQVRQQVKDLAFGKVANQAGLFETRKVIKDLLTEDAAGDKALGGLQKYYRNFTYDLYSKVDRTAAKMTADKLELRYAIYEGGLIKTSRKFCIERNGKVFTTDEIAEFDPPEAKQPDYNPATDLGGYGCRHHLNYIPYAVAVALRPDLKDDTAKPKVEPEPTEPTKPAPEKKATPAPSKIPPKTPFEDIEDYKYQPYKAETVVQEKAIEGYAEHAPAMERIKKLEKETLQAKNEAYSKLFNAPRGSEQFDKLMQEADVFKKRFSKLAELKRQTKAKQKVHELAFREDLMKGKSNAKVDMQVPDSMAKNKVFQDEGEKAFDFFRKAAEGWTDEWTFPIEVKATRGRAFARGKEINVNKEGPARVIVHELGHILEMNHNEIMKAAVDFLERRTAGNRLKKLKTLVPNSNYRPNELAKEGGFLDPYVGKFYQSQFKDHYKGLAATEVISMGLEHMFASPIEFKNTDPDHFNLIYSLFFKK